MYFKFLFTSHLVISHCPKQVIWLSPKSRHRKMYPTLVKDMQSVSLHGGRNSVQKFKTTVWKHKEAVLFWWKWPVTHSTYCKWTCFDNLSYLRQRSYLSIDKCVFYLSIDGVVGKWCSGPSTGIPLIILAHRGVQNMYQICHTMLFCRACKLKGVCTLLMVEKQRNSSHDRGKLESYMKFRFLCS